MRSAQCDGPISLWDRSALERDFRAAMEGPQAADVVVIGGGFTGLSTALHAAQMGLDCLVLEAEQIGFGGSGRNVGLVNAGLWVMPDEIPAVLGDTYGPRVLELLGGAPRVVFDLIARHDIQCAAT